MEEDTNRWMRKNFLEVDYNWMRKILGWKENREESWLRIMQELKNFQNLGFIDSAFSPDIELLLDTWNKEIVEEVLTETNLSALRKDTPE